MTDRPQIVGIGSTVYDTLMVTDGFPEEDTKMMGLETRIQGGGPCATALVAAQKLGVQTAYMGNVGDDPFGNFMVDDFARYGVSTDHIRKIPGQVSFHSVVLLNKKTGSRTCIWSKGTVSEPTPGDIDEQAVRQAQVLHVDGHMLQCALAAARIARDAGTNVSYDAGGTYPGVSELLPLVDWLIPSEEYALKMTGKKTAEEAAHQLYMQYHPALVVLTQGARGGILLDEKGMRRYASYPVPVVDSNGCGDTFHGAFAAAKIHGLDNDQACRYASAAAAIKCTRLGARTAMPTDEECRAFILSTEGAEHHAI